MYFKDRIVEFPNRKKIKVEDVLVGENGDIKEIQAYIFHDDGKVDVKGTPINAEEINSRFDSVYRAMDILFNKYFESVNMNVTWEQIRGYVHVQSFIIKKTIPIYAKVIKTNPYLEVTVTNRTSEIEVNIRETGDLANTTGSFTRLVDFYIELYLDQACTQFITRLRGLVKYINKSTDPLD